MATCPDSVTDILVYDAAEGLDAVDGTCALVLEELGGPVPGGFELSLFGFECHPNPDWERILFFLQPNVQKIQIWTESFDLPGIPVGGTYIPIDQSALLLAGVQSVSMWMIPVLIAGIGIGVFVIKRRN